MNNQDKIRELKEKLRKYEEKLAIKMKGYRGIVHENALSELRHSEVMVLKGLIQGLKEEIFRLEKER